MRRWTRPCFLMTMTKDEIFAIWAPEDSPWSRWAKPVLFAHLDSPGSHMPGQEPRQDVGWAPPPSEKVALVLDLPGAAGVLAGLALAKNGYRPVPLYNAVPLPSNEPLVDTETGRAVAAVNVFPVMISLRSGATELAGLRLPNDAPPVFLLDADRSADGRTMHPEEFDNRSISFTTDFPSAHFLSAHGVRRAILVQPDRIAPRPDLAHTFRRWQEAGVRLESKSLNSSGSPIALDVPRPSWYSAMFQRVLSGLRLLRAPNGGFGAWVPEDESPSAG